jgi:alpha-L-rhamnosidase
VLSRFGKTDMAYSLLLQETYPSWLYPVKMGATTIWERWNGIRTDSTFEPASMNSFNHYAYGAIGDWMYRVVAGLDTDEGEPGYRHLLIRPLPGKGLDHAEAALETPYGKASSGWKKNPDGSTVFEMNIPANSYATVLLPVSADAEIKESGQLLSEQNAIKVMSSGPQGVQLSMGSGHYIFTVNKK